MEELKEKLAHQTDGFCGQFKNKEDFLDRSYQDKDGSLNFGTRLEHVGKKTLRDFLVENGVDLSEL